MDITDELSAIGASAPTGAWEDVPPSDATIDGLWTDVRKLRAFAAAVLGDWPDSGTLDGGDVQELAIKHGLLRAKDPAPTRPCSDEGCFCAEYRGTDFNGEFDGGIECYERTTLLLGHNTKVTPNKTIEQDGHK